MRFNFDIQILSPILSEQPIVFYKVSFPRLSRLVETVDLMDMLFC